MKLNGKQIAIILASLLLAFIINWLLWLLIMGHPTEIDVIFHALVTICLAAAFVVIGDSLTKAEIFS